MSDHSRLNMNTEAAGARRFAELYDANIRAIYSYIFYRVRHIQTAEDLTSAVFLKAAEKFTAFDENKGTVAMWLYRIARNTLIDYYRNRRVTADLKDIDPEFSVVPGPEQSTHDVLLIERVERFLQSLSEEQRDIVIMRIWDNLSYKEISEITGKSEASCKMHVSRALAKIQTEIPTAIIAAALIAIKHYLNG